MTSPETFPEPELSRPVALESIGSAGYETTIRADEAERRALTERYGILDVAALEASVRLSWIRRKTRLSIRIALEAAVSQACIVTLEPVDETISEVIELVYARQDAEGPEVVIEGPDEAEPLTGDSLDLGEIVAEELALLLNPYPRHADATAEGLETGPVAESPFGVLASLQRKD